MTCSEDSITLTPPEVKEMAERITAELLPEKSKSRYEAQYNVFKKWCELKKIKSYSENVLLAYFTELVLENKKSLWSIYSMLKACILLYDNIDISKYAKLVSYLKWKTVTHKPKKSKILEEDHISSFIEQAPDDSYLLMKVALIIGISGSCRREELYKMVINDIQEKNDILLIEIETTKTNVRRSFVITNMEWIEIIKKYLNIRANVSKIKDRLFLRYEKGKCFSSPMGINTIGQIPAKIAEFLKLDSPKDYSGHCFRRSSATLLVNRGADILSLKRHAGWKSSKVAEGYLKESLKRKIQVTDMLAEPGASTSTKPTLSPLHIDFHNLFNPPHRDKPIS